MVSDATSVLGGRKAPVIGFTGRRNRASVIGAPHGFADAPVDIYFAEYSDSVHQYGGLAVDLPLGGDTDSLVDILDGLVITGGEDVDPRRYGQTPGPFTPLVDPIRDAAEIALVNAGIAKGIPVLGICRGHQILNVARGGTLIQHLEVGVGESHASYAYPRAYPTHEVSLDAGSLLARIYGSTIRVNSFHHQAIGAPGADVQIVGRAPDGIVEALEIAGTNAIGVQWHPEVFGRDPIFKWLVDTAEAGVGAGFTTINQEASV